MKLTLIAVRAEGLFLQSFTKMRILISLFLICAVGQLQSQTYEIGLFGGGANFIGDVGRTNYVYPTSIAFGGIAKWNKSKRYAWRGSLYYGLFVIDDNKSDLSSRQQRGFSTRNSVKEVSLGLEFNFLEYNLHKLGPAFTPYLYTGLTYFRYNFFYWDAGSRQNLDQEDGAFAIPMTLGFKSRINQYLILGVEVGARYTFTDNLDGSNPEGSNFEQFAFGNINSNDWYVFSGITLTYTFGRKPCTDCFE